MNTENELKKVEYIIDLYTELRTKENMVFVWFEKEDILRAVADSLSVRTTIVK